MFEIVVHGIPFGASQAETTGIFRQILQKPTQFRSVFTSTKIGSFFSAKDLLSKDELSMVIYQFTCACCKASYIGESTRSLLSVERDIWKQTRIRPSSNICSDTLTAKRPVVLIVFLFWTCHRHHIS